MHRLFIKKHFAKSEVIDRAYVEDQGVSLHRNSPFDLCLQIRTHTDKQGRMSLVHLTKAECLELATRLQVGAAELIEETAP